MKHRFICAGIAVRRLRLPGACGRGAGEALGAAEPVWARDGLELYCRSPTHLMAFTVRASDSFRDSAPA